jgi:hypothetical protein
MPTNRETMIVTFSTVDGEVLTREEVSFSTDAPSVRAKLGVINRTRPWRARGSSTTCCAPVSQRS